MKVDTICVHGDEPTAVEVAGAVRKRLEEEGIEIVPLNADEARSRLATWATERADEAIQPRISPLSGIRCLKSLDVASPGNSVSVHHCTELA